MVTLTIPDGKEIYTTHGDGVLSTTNRTELPVLQPCIHEEADTRIMVHVLDASLSGHKRIKIRSNDTDVIVLAISVVNTVLVDELWVAYGSGKHLHNLPAHTIARSLGQDKSSALPMFHAITGCDTVSFFGGRGKKTAWEVWKVFPELTPVLRALAASTEDISEEHMAVIERFAILLYDRTSSLRNINEARQELFSKKSRSLDNIPPTRAALVNHAKRAVFQGGFVWQQTLLKEPVIPCPSQWGWQREYSVWVPHWTTLQQAKDSCYELIHCGCRTVCRGRCKCVKANLACTGLCNCGGNCN